MLPPVDFQNLLQRAQKGDRDALGSLLEAVRPYLESAAHGYADPERASESTGDLVQEAWVRVWRGLERFDPGAVEGESFQRFCGWLAQIVERVGLNAQRDRQALKRHPEGREVLGVGSGGQLLASATSPSACLERTEAIERARAALEGVRDPEQREIVRMRFFEELSLLEIAKRLELSYDRVRDLFSAALRELEFRMEGRDPPANSAKAPPDGVF